MNWKLYLDDERNPEQSGWTVVRSTPMAVVTIIQRNQLPNEMSLDHDLGDGDDTMRFLKELFHIWEKWGSDPKLIPRYRVHSANPVGVRNIVSYMESWKRLAEL